MTPNRTLNMGCIWLVVNCAKVQVFASTKDGALSGAQCVARGGKADESPFVGLLQAEAAYETANALQTSAPESGVAMTRLW